jgi:plasmid maintenance system antidote protein VapI
VAYSAFVTKRKRKQRDLGEHFSEGSRLLWAVLAENKGLLSEEIRTAIGAGKGTVTRLLYGDRRAGRDLAATIEKVYGIPAASWGQNPKEPFELPGAA